MKENTTMALDLSPDGDLIFKGPFNVVSTTTLKLNNSGSERLAYKIKTTAPKRYCVKPNSGFLEPKTSAGIQVMLQPQTLGQPDDRNKHKFMVQWVAVPSSYTEDVDAFWKQDIKTLNVQDSKLKCVFMEDQPAANVNETPVEITNTSESRSQGHQNYASATSRSPPPSTQQINTTALPNPTKSQVSADDNNKNYKDEIDRLKQELDRCKENESSTDRSRQESNLRLRSTAGDRAGVINGTDHSKPNQHQAGLLIFGIQFNEQLVLVAIIVALLLGFSFGYFLFSCGN